MDEALLYATQRLRVVAAADPRLSSARVVKMPGRIEIHVDEHQAHLLAMLIEESTARALAE